MVLFAPPYAASLFAQGEAPSAVLDNFSTPLNMALAVQAPGVLANDNYNWLQPLTTTLISTVSHGTLNFNVDGGFTYTPHAGYGGVDSFTYQIQNDFQTSNVAVVNIWVGPIYVGCTNGVGNSNDLVSAINLANSSPEHDTIELGANCVYTLTSGYPVPYNGPSALVINRPLTINGNGSTITRSAVPGTPEFRIIYVTALFPATGDLTLNQATVSNGISSTGHGGGIYSYGRLVLRDSVITNNTNPSYAGGGIFAYGELVIERSSITNNGNNGVYSIDSLTVVDSLISGNTGYGISSMGIASILRSTIRGNGANTRHYEGRGIVNQGEMAISDSLIAFNIGGGISNGGLMTITNSTVTGNAGNQGGGIANGVKEAGGLEERLTIVNSTIWGNVANYGGGISSYPDLTGGLIPSIPITIENSIIAANDTGPAINLGDDIEGEITLIGHNLIGDTYGAIFEGDTARLKTGVFGKLGALQSNGGATDTLLPLEGSPVIDAGSCPSGYDQRGMPRPSDSPNYANTSGGNGCDLGAVEVQNPGGSPDPNPMPDPSLNHVPFAYPDWYFINAVNPSTGNWEITVPADTGMLANDMDEDNDELSAVLAVWPYAGTLNMNPDGGFTFSVNSDELADLDYVQFWYTATDGKGYSNINWVSIHLGDPFNNPEDPIDPQAPQGLETGGFSSKPTYYWTHTSGLGSTVPDDWYRVVVIGDVVMLDEWHFFLNVCVGTYCQITPDIELMDGTYSWYVESYNADTGLFHKSSTATLVVDTDGIPSPGLITRIAPTRGTNFTNGQVKFQWMADTHALWYRMVVFSPNGFLFDQWYDGSKICQQEICTVVRPLPSGSYDWYMVAWGPGGMGSWGGPTSGITFTVGTGTPGIVVPLYPGDSETLDIPAGGIELTWQSDPNAAYYRLYVSGPNGYAYDQWQDAGEVCDTETCSTTLYLNSGAYVWYLVGWSSEGIGDWNAGATFAINTPKPDIIQRISPQGEALTPTVTFKWQADPNAGWYRIFALNSDDGYVYDQWVRGVEACAGELCSFSDGVIPNGSYSWWIGAWSPGGMSDWDLTPMNFSINIPQPSTVSPTTPLNGSGVLAGTVRLEWQADNNALWYHVMVESEAGFSYDKWLKAKALCFGDICSVPLNLTPGIYRWQMQAWGPGGMGSMNTPIHFTVNPQV